ncbi:Gfo/Idh/MocA family protein [Magnetospirillum sulfuroxidans]|uniref:Gfo/Idh/MocA family oxidoreductase n=1 Tax=Magnetospirillum sulfuroxidans TaxID=611300 RepID=A0ABS5IHP6_9PROT|nr:Gfo/Idh/MocA family oxidoreductase [Magnetospirillum sulfuroxidans]MBR9973722.1 Gfo/Idh/MocA family oxidoreductase [Magnetospirillum sulfuroxidans]
MRVAVVGTGNMGSNHLRVYSQLQGPELVGLVDPDRNRAEALAKQYGCQVFDRVEDLIGKVDAVTIASPSVTHGEIGTLLLANGIHCLVEKPLAVSEEQCQALIGAAEKSGAVLMVGHIERFNPAVDQLGQFLAGGHKVFALDARRMSAVSSRITDVDVVMDLMIHDLDVANGLISDDIVSVQAQGIDVQGFGHDFVTALVRYASGTVASFTASRITQNKIRQLHITADIGFIEADYLRQEMMIYRQSRASDLPTGSAGGYVMDLAMDRVYVRHSEPLVREISHFVEVVKKGGQPKTDGASALRSLRLAWAIQDALKAGA